MDGDQKQLLSPFSNQVDKSDDDIINPDSKQWAKKWCVQKNKCFIFQDSKAVASEDNKANSGQIDKSKKKKKKKCL